MEKSKTKILIIHTKYQEKGGEDIAVENEIKFLEDNFITNKIVISNHGNFLVLSLLLIFRSNFRINRILKKELSNFKPDFVYVHNTWFKIGLKIFDILNHQNIKYFIKLHNFRYDCTHTFSHSAHFQDKDFCMSCGISKKNNMRFNKYFSNSYLKSFFVILYGRRYIEILKNIKTNIIVLTEFHKKYLIRKYSLEAEKISVFPNFISDDTKNNFKELDEDYIVYAGRISSEKGVDELISSFINADIENLSLYIVGNGPQEKFVNKKYENNKIKFLGYQDHKNTLNIIKNAKAVITNTKMYEGQPTLLCEASLLSVPAIFPRNGGIEEFFPEKYPLSFSQSQLKDLEHVLGQLSDYDLQDLGNKNFNFITKKLNEHDLSEQLLEIFNFNNS